MSGTLSEQTVWMAIGRQMFKACESTNVRRACSTGSLRCTLTKHLIAVTIQGSRRMLRIGKQAPTGGGKRATFFFAVSDGGKVFSPSYTFWTLDGTYFRIDRANPVLTLDQMCNRMLAMLCQ
jgi:hypothetical protein